VIPHDERPHLLRRLIVAAKLGRSNVCIACEVEKGKVKLEKGVITRALYVRAGPDLEIVIEDLFSESCAVVGNYALVQDRDVVWPIFRWIIRFPVSEIL
jgi:hypothetical protein